MRAVAVIPARGGSKRIPRKNVRSFLGKPIIAYSIDAARRSGVFDEIMVSTDDKEIAEISKGLGASVPFMRSAETSDDFAGQAEVMLEVLSMYAQGGLRFDLLCCLSATAPFVNPERFREASRLLVNDQSLESVTLVAPFSYPIQRALRIQEERMSMIWPENYPKRSQDLEPAYHDCGLFDFVRVESFLKQERLYCENAQGIVLDDSECQDIDTELDFRLAELKYQLLHQNVGR